MEMISKDIDNFPPSDKGPYRKVGDKSAPLISIIIPTFNRSERLSQAVESALKQTYKNIEVIIVNDNVADSEQDRATEKVADAYCEKDIRTRSIHTDGKVGGGRARNIACRHACGDYLAFLDDDDVFLPDKIETQLEFMQAGDYEMTWQDIAWYNDEGKLVEYRRLDHCSDYSKEGLLRAHLLIPISPTSIFMIKKNLFDRTEGFGEVATGQDWWLMLRCIEAGAKIGYMPGVHVHQYLHNGERLSLGVNKIEGEKARHNAISAYYPSLSKEDIVYIEFRHNAVLAVSSARSKAFIKAIKYLFNAFTISPSLFFNEGIKLIKSSKEA